MIGGGGGGGAVSKKHFWAPRASVWSKNKGGGAVSKKHFWAPRASVWSKNKGGGGEGPRAPPQDSPLLSKRHAFLSSKLTILLSSNVAGGRRGKLTWLVFLRTSSESNAKLISFTDLPRRDRVLDYHQLALDWSSKDRLTSSPLQNLQLCHWLRSRLRSELLLK